MPQSPRSSNLRHLQQGSPRLALTALVVALVCSACETPPKAPPPAPPPPVEAPAPLPPPPPAPPTKEEKDRSQKITLEGMDLLQKGDEASGRNQLEQALKLDPGNENARKLLDQITADPQTKLGPVFWKYTIRGNDSLASVAQRFLGDRLLFYILARYNGITVPNRLSAGQIIKVPGKEPKIKPLPIPLPPLPTPLGSDSTPTKPESPKPQETPAGPAGSAPVPTPSPATTPQAEISKLIRAAEVCQSKQNLDCSIDNWNKVLAIDPGNEQARYKRDSLIKMRDKLKNR